MLFSAVLTVQNDIAKYYYLNEHVVPFTHNVSLLQYIKKQNIHYIHDKSILKTKSFDQLIQLQSE